MKHLILRLCLFAALLTGLSGEPTESREWSAVTGHKTTARALSATAAAVTLELASGKTIELPLDKLITADQTFIREHFDIEAPKENEPMRTGAAPANADELPYPPGKISGPVESAPGSSYHIYLPNSLKSGRKAPLLHFNGSGGGNPGQMQRYLAGVERFGWILVASVESKNGNSFQANHVHAANNISHLKKSPLIDEDRIYFTGQSGGGAMCWWNAANLNAAGTLPVMSYIHSDVKISKGHHFVLIGATDYNRYHSAKAAARFGKDAFFRSYPGGHSFPPDSEPHIIEEGIAWLTAKYLQKNASNNSLADDRIDFEAAMLNWIDELAPTNPHQAYHLTQLLSTTYGIRGKNADLLSKTQSGLASTPAHPAYHNGINEIHDFGVKEFATHQYTGNGKGQNSADHTRKAERLSEKYKGIPFVEATFTELGKAAQK